MPRQAHVQHLRLAGHVGEGAGTLILEELEHARARGAQIRAEVVGFGTNSDGFHSTHPSSATMRAVFGARVPISSLESYMGHTLGACGALEAWMSIQFMNEGWAPPTLNPECAELDYIQGGLREISAAYLMSTTLHSAASTHP